jgi:hypothetical protein
MADYQNIAIEHIHDVRFVLGVVCDSHSTARKLVNLSGNVVSIFDQACNDHNAYSFVVCGTGIQVSLHGRISDLSAYHSAIARV